MLHNLFYVLLLLLLCLLLNGYQHTALQVQVLTPSCIGFVSLGVVIWPHKRSAVGGGGDGSTRSGTDSSINTNLRSRSFEMNRNDNNSTSTVQFQHQQQHRSIVSLPLQHFKDPKTVISKEDIIIPTAISSSGLHVVYFFMDGANSNKKDSNTTTSTTTSDDVLVNYYKEIILHNVKTLSPNTAWQTHVITNNDKLIQLLEAANNNNSNNNNKIQVVDFRKLPKSDRVNRFQQTYVSQSRNNVDYESFCMWRWIVIAEYFTRLSKEDTTVTTSSKSATNHYANDIPVKNILALDTDVVLVDDPFLTVKTQIDWTTVQSYRIISGAAMIWTLSGLESFVTFLLDVYATPTMAIELAKQHGTIYHVCHKDRSLLIPCFHPNMNDSNLPASSMWHISDMEWYRAWSRQDLTKRLTRPDPHLIPCYVISHINEEHTYRFIRLGSDDILASPESDEQALKRVCLVHFQGETKNGVIPFLKFLQGDSPVYYLPPHHQ